MNSSLVKIQKIISESSLSKKDLKFIIDLFEKYPEQIEILNKFYKLKRKALKNKDRKAWDNILQQEYKILEEIEKN